MAGAMQIRTQDINNDFLCVLKKHFYGQSIVVLPETEYREMARIKHNAEYLARLDKAARDIDEGRGIIKTMAELEAMANV